MQPKAPATARELTAKGAKAAVCDPSLRMTRR